MMADNKASGKSKKMTKTALYQELATATKLSKKQVAELFDALSAVIKKELGKKGPGEFTIPGLVKLKLQRKPATKAGKRPNPFKPGEMMDVKARPARTVVKPRPLKTLQEMVK
jgi:nucleoid DNA-binding protein